ncbi:hypothetical protein DDZ13_05875 [Coraliomargarita sinensis]|uniref:Uncharacterized protein n=1 Tax=Coraliomargarita sinensis TaxID=2174842 RepID=A0A317ZL74_9BACT|nr:hypothetical protein [Coraliomargarita sinensis]PXA04698.1 hypothetical protein DDZ13_05875 [Coraliomargarita sinensis]
MDEEAIRKWYFDYEYPDKREIKGRDLITAVESVTTRRRYETVIFVWMRGERDAKEGFSGVYAKGFRGIHEQLDDDPKPSEIYFVPTFR